MDLNKSESMFDYIIVIESVREHDKKIGLEIYNSVIERKCDQMSFGSFYKFVNNLEELISEFRDMEYLLIHYDKIPMIHIEAHGSIDEIELASGERIHWTTLGLFLGNINRLSRNNVKVVLSCCHGINMTRALNLLSPVPYYLLVAPEGEPNEPDLENGFIEFYETLLDGFMNFDYGASFPESMRKLNHEKDVIFYYAFAKDRFEKAWNEARERYNTVEKINLMVDSIFESATITGVTSEQAKKMYFNILYHGDKVKEACYKRFMLID